jgi:tetratricopeptide (TPR) repeat protein
MDMPLSVLKDALKQRDEIVEAYKQAAVEALRALENARKADDLKTAVRIAYFGEKDFAKAEQKVEFSKALAELKKDAGYKEALAAIESEIKYREIAANVIKEELKLFEKKRKGQKVNYSSVIEGYQKALSVAPFGVVADNLKKHIESLKKGE